MTNVEIKKIQKGLYYEFYVEVSSMGKKSQSPKTAVPPTIRYNKDTFQLLTLPDLEKEVPKSNYFVGTGDFSRERLLNHNTSLYINHFDRFSTIERTLVNGKWIDHPLSATISELEVKFEPLKEFQTEIDSLPYIEGGKLLANTLCKHKPEIEKQLGYSLDLFTVPKRDIGERVYIADEKGTSFASRLFSFGFVDTFPVDRVTREIKSLRQAEVFLNPWHPAEVFSLLQPFTTFLRVAIVKTKERMLDGGDLFISGQEKVACNLSKIVYDTDFTSLSDPNITFKVNRGGIDVWRSTVLDYDERVHGVGPCRLVMPGGVKVCVDPKDIHPTTLSGQPIDLLIDFKTVADKGALGLFSMVDENSFGRRWTYEEAYNCFQERETSTIAYDDGYLEGYVCMIPVFRPRQRHTEICKTATNTLDLISYAILNKRMKVSKYVEKDYQDLRAFRQELLQERIRLNEVPTTAEEFSGVS